MNYMISDWIKFVVFIFICPIAQGQSLVCPSIEAGNPQTINCSESCTDLTASFLDLRETDSYIVEGIPHAPPIAYDQAGGTAISVNIDDRWSNVINLPFPFCFFGTTYNSLIVGSNGHINFNIANQGGACPWAFTQNCPSPGLVTSGNVFGILHDVDPSECGDIKWHINGTAPCRQFIASFDEICQYSCTSLKSRHMMVLYETSNIIDVYVESKPLCAGWNGGRAIIGIQNATGTDGITAPNRNSAPTWNAATPEGWRFKPNGIPTYTLQWTDGTNVLGTDPVINVCPSVTTTYQAEIAYTLCDGSILNESDNVTVTVSPNDLLVSEVNNSNATCGQSNGEVEISASGGMFPYTYSIDGVGYGNSGVFSNLASGSYDLFAQDASGCSQVFNVVVNEIPFSAAITSVANESCTGLNDGSITLLGENGQGSYSYYLSGFGSQNDGQFSGLDAGVYQFVISDNSGCSIVIDTILTANAQDTPTFTGLNPVCSGDTFLMPDISNNGISGYWLPNINSETTTTYLFTPNAGECATQQTMTVNVNDQSSGTDPHTACDSYTWMDGNNYTLSNNEATWTLSNALGCDSTVTLDLTLTHSNSGTDIKEACDSYTWIDGNTYSTSNNSATWILTNALGCDSTVTLDLNLTHSNSGIDVQESCDSYTWIDGNTYASSNNSATWILTNAAGCDSTVTLDLNLTNSNSGIDVQESCDSYTWIDGNTYAASNNSAIWILTNAAGCDSTVTLDLTLTNSNSGSDIQEACDSYTWIDGITYTASNNAATWILTNASGCDSTVTLDLNLTNSNSGTDMQEACDAYTWEDGLEYTSSNNSATRILTNTWGCDSTVLLDLTIINSSTGIDFQTACDSYTWIDGIIYTASENSATWYLTNAVGCDSIVTLDLTLTNSNSGTDSQVACDSYTWIDGNIYPESNNAATWILTNASGCDSMVTLDLTVTNSNTGLDNQVACDSYTWIDGNTYTESNNTASWVLTNTEGCDSIVTLDLTVTNSNTGIDSHLACDSYAWIDGNTYSESNNTATWVLTNESGCDSTVTLDLSLTNSNTGIDNQVSCDSYTWIDGNTYSESNNTATWILINESGCDSTVTLALIINVTPSFVLSGTDPTVCNANDGSITLSGLTANTQYTFSYDYLGTVVPSASFYSSANGECLISDLFAGLYSDFSILLNGCQFMNQGPIDLNNPGAPSLDLQLDTTVCDAFTLVSISGDNLSGNEAYYTENNGNGTQINVGEILVYSQTIYIYDITGSCADQSNFFVTVNNTPSIVNPGPQEVCESFILPLGVLGENLSGNQNYYTDSQSNGGLPINDAILVSQTVYVFDQNASCSDEIFFEITINDLPTLISFTGEGVYCAGDVIDDLVVEVSGLPDFTLDYTLDGTPFNLSFNSASLGLGNTSGVYILTALSDNVCNTVLNEVQTVVVNPLPVAPDVSDDVVYCANVVPEELIASGGLGIFTWYMDPSLAQIINTGETLIPNVVQGSTTYYVTSTENNCEGPSSNVTVSFEECGIIVPSAFTPDNDMVNDFWALENIDTVYPLNRVLIYNRLGNKIFESVSGSYAQRPWDGTFNGKLLPVASYYYIIEFNDGVTANSVGNISILK